MITFESSVDRGEGTRIWDLDTGLSQSLLAYADCAYSSVILAEIVLAGYLRQRAGSSYYDEWFSVVRWTLLPWQMLKRWASIRWLASITTVSVSNT